MRIEKFVKDKKNKYKVTIDSEDYILYDDVIIKYELIRKSNIDRKLLDEIISLNAELKSYYDSIKYITKKLRSEKEIYEYLHKHEISDEIIEKTIKHLKDNNFLNEEVFLKAYINDQINLSNNGPKKIRINLYNLGINENLVDEAISNISSSVWTQKISKYIDKKIKTNHASSEYMLKIKITKELINLGYDEYDINQEIAKYDIIDTDILNKEMEKARRELSRKYSGYELEQKIRARLYRKGFKVSEIKENIYEE